MYDDEFGASSSFNNFTGYIMREDVVCAAVEENNITDIQSFAPLQIQKRGDFDEWLEDRSADLNRSYMRNILKHLRLSVTDGVSAVKYVHAASLIDTFWIKGKNTELKYSDIVFRNDLYFKAALAGDPDLFSKDRVHTPEVTNIGSYNKGWRFENGAWRMYKAGSPLETWSEIFTSRLAERLNLDTVLYNCVDGFVVCDNFVKKGYCFEAAKALIGSDTGYAKNIDIMRKYDLLKKYLDIIYMDAIVRNGDRHEFNYGFITSDVTIDLAPNFDNNMSMFWNGIPTNLERKDMLVSELKDVLDDLDYSLPTLTDGDIQYAYKKAIGECEGKVTLPDIPLDTVINFCMNAYTQLLK